MEQDSDKPVLSTAQQALLKKRLSNLSLSNKSAVTEIKKSIYQDTAPLSAGQRRLWYMNMLEPDSGVYNVPMTYRLRGAVDVALLEKSFQLLLARHESLRTAIVLHDNEPTQQIVSELSIALEKMDFRHFSSEQKQRELDKAIAQLWSEAFDISKAPLWRVSLLQLSDDESILCMVFYHAIFDGWSGDIILRELTRTYSTLIQGAISETKEDTLQYADYAFWQRDRLKGAQTRKQLDFWVQHLGAGSLPVLQLPTDFVRPAIQSYEGASVSGHIDNKTVGKLTELAQEENATLFMALLAMYGLLLGRYSGDSELIVALPVAGRSCKEWEGVVGYFANTLALRIELDDEMSFRSLLRQVRKNSISAYGHAELPFDQLVEEIKPVRDMSRTPIFQTLFGFRNQLQEINTMADVSLEPAVFESKLSQTDISFWLEQRSTGVDISIDYCTALFRKETIKQLLGYFVVLAKQVIATPDCNINDLSLVDDANDLPNGRVSGDALLVDGQDALNGFSIAHRMHAKALLRPNAAAVIFHDETLSHRELDELSSQWANCLAQKGVSKADRIGLCIDRSQYMIVGLLGILKLGATYVPLDPDFPAERLAYMVKDSGLKYLVTQQNLWRDLPDVENVFFLDDIKTELPACGATLPNVEIEGDTPAYIIYTSGSTGKPKGVVVQQSAIFNFLHGMARKPGFSENDVMLAVTTLSFDIATLELYLPLLCGGSVVIAEKRDSADGRCLLKMLDKYDVTCMQATPATWRLLISSGWNGSRSLKALCGGEALAADLAEQLIERTSELWNMYGPTETTVWSTCALVTTLREVTSIGSPIANTDIFVLDKNLQAVPRGFVGELYIGGSGIALGYHNRAELTAAAFIQSPFDNAQRIYKTGDKVRICSDGRLEYLGRFDQQVKVRGYRIELGEIETLLRQNKAVDDCAVIVREVRAGDVRLTAFVVWQGAAKTMTEIRRFLSKKLPPYMIPQHIESIDALPRTANNKLDRKLLQGLLGAGVAEQQHHEPPTTPEEKWLAALWQELTGAELVSKQDNFFDIGGHSLLSMQVLYRIADEKGVTLNPRDILLENMGQIALKITAESNNIEQLPDLALTNSNFPLEQENKKNLDKSDGFFSKLRKLMRG